MADRGEDREIKAPVETKETEKSRESLQLATKIDPPRGLPAGR